MMADMLRELHSDKAADKDAAGNEVPLGEAKADAPKADKMSNAESSERAEEQTEGMKPKDKPKDKDDKKSSLRRTLERMLERR